MNELRAEHEKSIYTLTSELTTKFDQELQRADAEFKTHVTKLLEEASAKDERIRALEKNEKKAIAERERHQSQEQQLKILGEQLKSV
jgi:23S rRNA pseudoU1915 N3-methylase RlmH